MDLQKEVETLLNEHFDQESDLVDFLDQRGDGKHYALRIISDKFTSLNRIQRSKMVYSLLNDYLTTGKIHALQMELKTPEEKNNA